MDSPVEASKSSSIKVVSKSARAKKLLNKKIKINQHIKFDEDGEPVDQDSTGDKLDYPAEEKSSSSESEDEQALQPISIDEFEKSKKCVKIGGIKIEKAKQLLRLRDKMDRKRERERIRTAHRERRLKSRQAMKVGDDEDKEEDVASEGVRLAGASSSEEEIEEELLSEMEEDEQRYTQPQPFLTEGDSELLSSDEEGVQRKRQKLGNSVKSKKKSRRKHKQLVAEPEPASLVEDEELALHLLLS